MKQRLIVGIDVSKGTLDVYCMPTGRHIQVKNDPSGFARLMRFLQDQLSPDVEILVVMEHTGLYSYQLECFLKSQAIQYHKVPALQIKRSLGMVRGKDDKIDAERIAKYGWLRSQFIKADHYPTEALTKLKTLLSTRHKLVRDRTGYMNRVREILSSGLFKEADELIKLQHQIINQLSRDIKIVEREIRQLIKQDEAIDKTFRVLISIKGVGLIIGAAMIAYTQNFTVFKSARKFNCYAGLAPFKHESGRSIKKKARVSHLANKTIKTLLSMAASTAILHDPELRDYYQRRLAEGKQKGSCLNIIKAKLVARIFAVAKRQTPYQIINLAA